MDFELSEQQQLIRTEVRNLARQFDWGYWRDLDRTGEYPHAFFNEFAANGWLGTVIPAEYGGSGLGVTEAAIVLLEICASGAGNVRRFTHSLLDVPAHAHHFARQ